MPCPLMNVVDPAIVPIVLPLTSGSNSSPGRL
jgi:hypothetical protein